MTVVQIAEAGKLSASQLTGKTWKIKIIEGDRQGSSAYYPKEVLESGKHLFAEGTRIFLNHPSMDEKWNQPERRVEDIVGYLSEDATYDGKDLYANATFLESQQQRIKELAEAGLIGMSIRASGEMTEGTNGMELKKFTAVHSVDVVTQAGAGGGFEKLLESARQISASESGAESLEEKESVMDPKLEAALDALVETSKQNAEAVAKLVERAEREDTEKADLAEAARKQAEEDSKAKAPTAAEIAGALVEAELPKAAHAKVIAAVEAGTELAEAIKNEKAYLETVLTESGKTFAGNGSEEVSEADSKKNIGANIFGS